MTSQKPSNVCSCHVIHPNDIVTNRCINGSSKHKTCGGIIQSLRQKVVVTNDRPGIEYRNE